MKPIPADYIAYKRTPDFTDINIPEALTRRHDTKPGAWAKIVVLEGALNYEVMTDPVQHYTIDAEHPGIIEQQLPHRVTPIRVPLRFYLEFYKQDETDAATLVRAMDADLFTPPSQ